MTTIHLQSPIEHLGFQRGLPYEQLEHRLLQSNRATDCGHRGLAFYLHQMDERGLHQAGGHASTAHWAAARLGMEPRTARDLILCGRRLLELTELDAAFAEGWLCWSKVRIIARYTRPETQRDWIERAKQVPTRRLEAELQANNGGKPPTDKRNGLPQVRFRVTASLDAVAYEAWEQCKRKLAAESGRPFGSTGGIGDEEVLAAAVRLILSSNADGSIPGRTPVAESAYRVVLRCNAEHDTAEVVTEDGAMPIPAAQASALLCQGAVMEATPGMTAPTKSPPTPESLRRRILARDGHHCLACGGHGDLHVHHLIWREHGGPTEPGNLLTLCNRCHSLVHEGLLHIEGQAPGGLAFLDDRGLPTRRFVNVAATPELATDLASGLATGLATGKATATPVEGPPPSQPAVVRFQDLPARADSAWWIRHEHLLDWSDRRGVLEFREGVPASGAAPAPTNLAHEMAHVRRRDDDNTAPTDPLAAIIGQDRAVAALRIALAAALAEDRPLPHMLLSGPPGVGKTALARALAQELGVEPMSLAAPLLDEVPKLVALLRSLRPGDLLFLDELHALPRNVAEVLYGALQDRTLALPMACGSQRRTLTLALPPFTCVGATTDEGALPDPLRARFPLNLPLARLGDGEMACLLQRAEPRLSAGAADVLAEVARGTPRQGLALLGRARDEMLAQRAPRINATCARTALARAGIDHRGLWPVERDLLQLLRDGRPRALAQIAAQLGLPAATVAKLHEPFLVQLGLLRITPRGRLAATAG